MMRSFRFPIVGLMGAVVVAAIAMAAMRRPSETWAGVMYLLTRAALCLAVVGLVCRGRDERAWWLGVNLFGWGYWNLAFWDWPELAPVLPTTSLLKGLGFLIGFPANHFDRLGFEIPGLPFLQTGHCLWTFVAAILGGTLARVCFGASAGRFENNSGAPQPTMTAPRRPWLWPVIVASAAVGLIAAVALSGSKLDPELKAGTIYLLTRGLIGVACLGAFLGRGTAREIWLGASLFGASYMFMIFDRSAEFGLLRDPPTAQFLNAFRIEFPKAMRAFSGELFNITAANTGVLNTLEQPIPVPFRDDTPLEVLLQHIQTATAGPDGKGVPIYVDPIGLQEAGTSMISTVSMTDLEGVPLKTILRLCMEQLGLRYEVTGGMVLITSDRSLSENDDAFITAGQCVLALIAATVGGALAPLVSGLRRRPVARRGDVV